VDGQVDARGALQIELRGMIEAIEAAKRKAQSGNHVVTAAFSLLNLDQLAGGARGSDDV
jgi:hypothetical protein